MLCFLTHPVLVLLKNIIHFIYVSSKAVALDGTIVTVLRNIILSIDGWSFIYVKGNAKLF